MRHNICHQSCNQSLLNLVLSTGRKYQVSYSSGSTRNRTAEMCYTTQTTRLFENLPVLPRTTQDFSFTTLPPIKHWSCDCIVTWSVHISCSSSRSSTSRFQIGDPTNIHLVPIWNPLFLLNICPYIAATQWISVWSQIWMLEVKELEKLHALCIIMSWYDRNSTT